MIREDVYRAIDTEREYQEKLTEDPNVEEMVADFQLAHGLLAIQKILTEAIESWYYDNPQADYAETMEYVRKIAGVCVKMGEEYKMPSRDVV